MKSKVFGFKILFVMLAVLTAGICFGVGVKPKVQKPVVIAQSTKVNLGKTGAKEDYSALFDGNVIFSAAANTQIKKLEDLGFGSFPVCMAKNQYSLSDDPSLLGRPEGFDLNIREVYVSAGAGFVVVLTGAVMTMPGLPKTPAAYGIDVNDDGKITGLF